MSLPSTSVIPILGAILAAIITGTISIVNILIAKDEKISEFRQKWIDELRNDISKYLARMHTFSRLIHERIITNAGPLSPDDYNTYYSRVMHPEFRELNILSNKIQLRLNPNEHTDMINNMKDIENRFNNIEPSQGNADFDAIARGLDILLLNAQTILKEEWLRVRRGEIIYRCAKWCALTFIVFSITAFIYFFIMGKLNIIPIN